MNSIDQSEESIYLTHVSGQSDGEASVEEHVSSVNKLSWKRGMFSNLNLNNNVPLASK